MFCVQVDHLCSCLHELAALLLVSNVQTRRHDVGVPAIFICSGCICNGLNTTCGHFMCRTIDSEM